MQFRSRFEKPNSRNAEYGMTFSSKVKEAVIIHELVNHPVIHLIQFGLFVIHTAHEPCWWPGFLGFCVMKRVFQPLPSSALLPPPPHPARGCDASPSQG